MLSVIVIKMLPAGFCIIRYIAYRAIYAHLIGSKCVMTDCKLVEIRKTVFRILIEMNSCKRTMKEHRLILFLWKDINAMLPAIIRSGLIA